MSSVPAFPSSNLAAWRHAFRLRTLPLAAACILLGSGLAGLQGGGSWRIGLLALLTTFLLQILANLANDYGDTLHGADGPLRIGPPRAMQQGWIRPAAMRRAIALCGLLAALSGAALLLLAWPAWAIARTLARAYRDKRFSDLWYLLAAYWLVVLAASALPALQGVGWIALTQFIPWLWIPLAAWGLRGWLAPRGAPPTLLVLRVFQQDTAVETLFDRVIERWRLTGTTVLIAGTDLISRTLDPDDLFTFLNGRLGERFIASPAQVPQRLADFDLQPDPDGRYRVNECYCFDSTWQQALAALVAQADVVLMDLRGFQARNQGCRHELGVLATAAHLQRVVLLFDASTDRGTALADLALAPAGRVVWVEAGRLEQKRVAQIVGALLGASSASASGEVVEAAR